MGHVMCVCLSGVCIYVENVCFKLKMQPQHNQQMLTVVDIITVFIKYAHAKTRQRSLSTHMRNNQIQKICDSKYLFMFSICKPQEYIINVCTMFIYNTLDILLTALWMMRFIR